MLLKSTKRSSKIVLQKVQKKTCVHVLKYKFGECSQCKNCISWVTVAAGKSGAELRKHWSRIIECCHFDFFWPNKIKGAKKDRCVTTRAFSPISVAQEKVGLGLSKGFYEIVKWTNSTGWKVITAACATWIYLLLTLLFFFHNDWLQFLKICSTVRRCTKTICHVY